MLKEYLRGTDHTHFVYPSGVDCFKEQFAHLEECDGRRERNSPHRKHATSLPREHICSTDETDIVVIKRSANSVTRPTVQSPPKWQAAEESQSTEELQSANRNAVAVQANSTKPKCSTRSLLKSDSICASMCIGIVGNDREVHAL
ncbi:mitogen-activated protein kinase 17-like [Euphorbia lathyris]|uniref:mitogen-activated protein kinase 17-like n=1 Tax=Euphorbia lathyris TaxID=212925 RepID=UPI0033142D28